MIALVGALGAIAVAGAGGETRTASRHADRSLDRQQHTELVRRSSRASSEERPAKSEPRPAPQREARPAEQPKQRSTASSATSGTLLEALYRSAAGYLGLSDAELGEALAGQSLGQLAVARDLTVEGLRRAMHATVEKRIAADDLAPARRRGRLARLDRRIEKLLKHVRRH